MPPELFAASGSAVELVLLGLSFIAYLSSCWHLVTHKEPQHSCYVMYGMR